MTWAWPTRLRFDRADGVLRVRHVRAWPLEKRFTRSDVREVLLTRNPGGPFGAFVARPRENGPVPPLHVVLALEAGDVRLVNRDQTPDSELRAFARALAHAIGRPCRESDEGWNASSAS